MRASKLIGIILIVVIGYILLRKLIGAIFGLPLTLLILVVLILVFMSRDRR